jgi:hypothetical protein
MAPFAYLSVLTSIVLAAGITRLLTGVGKMLQARHKIELDWVHLVWILNVFLYMVLNWWILFRWQTQQEWNYFLFLFVLISPIVCFLLSVLLFPNRIEECCDMRNYFSENRRSFFLLAATLTPIDLVDTMLKGLAHFYAQGPYYIFTILLVFTLCMIGAFTKSEKYHKFFAIFFLMYILAFIAINLRMLA